MLLQATVWIGLIVLASWGLACDRAPSTDEVREMELALDAIPYDPRDGTIADDRLQAFLGVRRAIFAVEFEGRANVDALRRANESNAATMTQINRVRRHTNRVLAARARHSPRPA